MYIIIFYVTVIIVLLKNCPSLIATWYNFHYKLIIQMLIQ